METTQPQTSALSPALEQDNTGAVSQPQTSRDTLISPLVRHLCSPPVRVADLISLSIALFLTAFSNSLEAGQSLGDYLGMRISVRNLVLGVLLLALWRLIFWTTGMYQPRLNRSASTFLWRVPLSVLVCTAVAAPLFLLAHQTPEMAFHSSFIFWFAGTTLMFAARAATYTFDEHIRPSLRTPRNIIVVGTGPRARLMSTRLRQHPDYSYRICGFVDSDPQPHTAALGPLLGGIDDLPNILMRQPIDEVLIALPIKSSFSQVERVMAICGHAGIQTQYSLDLFTTEIAKHHATDENTGVRVVEMVHDDHRLFLKNVLDRLVATLGLLLLSPVFLAIALAIKLTSKGPVFFVQQRWGKNKRTFGMIKFRSMVVDAEARQAALEHLNEFGGPMFKMKNDPRITAVGRFIRRTSLDELPQLINVLKGEMSLVGPRPLPNRDVDRFEEPWLMRRFSVKPGITGLWQVSGRSNTDFDQTIQLDLRYIDRWSLMLDLKIIARTFAVVLKGRGAY